MGGYGRTHGRTNERMDGRTEIWTPISHPAISRCDKNEIGRTSKDFYICFVATKYSFVNKTCISESENCLDHLTTAFKFK